MTTNAPTHATLQIKGMSCASCVNHTQKALLKVDGVTEASVNLATEEAFVTYIPAKASEAQLIQAVADAGYQATIVKKK